jgi:hypothetical protein
MLGDRALEMRRREDAASMRPVKQKQRRHHGQLIGRAAKPSRHNSMFTLAKMNVSFIAMIGLSSDTLRLTADSHLHVIMTYSFAQSP